MLAQNSVCLLRSLSCTWACHCRPPPRHCRHSAFLAATSSTHGSEKFTTLQGATHIVRSDGCAGQMKSGRHFRFISNFHTYTGWNLGITLIWTHSESCHGKDLSDPECGRAKFILRCHEMRHTADCPTMLKSSREQYEHLEAHHCLTRRSLREKRGRGHLHSCVPLDASQEHSTAVVPC